MAKKKAFPRQTTSSDKIALAKARQNTMRNKAKKKAFPRQTTSSDKIALAKARQNTMRKATKTTGTTRTR